MTDNLTEATERYPKRATKKPIIVERRYIGVASGNEFMRKRLEPLQECTHHLGTRSDHKRNRLLNR